MPDLASAAALGVKGDRNALREKLRQRDPHLAFMRRAPGLGMWGAADWQRAVLEDPANRILVRGGNKVGKSLELAEECALFLDGKHPTRHRPTDRPARILYVVADLKNAYASDVCRTLAEVMPPAKLHARTKYDEIRGYSVSGSRSLLWHDGSEIMFRSGTQDGQAIAGIWADLVVINEPPIRARWGEIMRAAALTRAPVVVGFTPMDSHGSRDLLWLRDIVEGVPGGDTPKGADGRPLWSQHVVRLVPESVPHRRESDVMDQIANMAPWEVAQRRDAEWEGPAPERTLSAFGPGNTFEARPGDWDALPGAASASSLRFGISADHGERANKEVLILYAWVGTGPDVRVWVLDCYLSPGQTSVAQDAEAVVQMLARWGLTLDSVDEAKGDTNSSGKGDVTSRTVNDAFTAAFAALGSRLRMVAADKGAGSVGLGVRVMNDAFARSALWLCRGASELVRACQRWDGGNASPHKDKVDAIRYGPASKIRPVVASARTRTTPRMPPADTAWFVGDMWEGESDGF